jgi:hypothetical protein
MSKLRIGIGTEADFFADGKRVARSADRGEALVDTYTITFEDPADVVDFLTEECMGEVQFDCPRSLR